MHIQILIKLDGILSCQMTIVLVLYYIYYSLIYSHIKQFIVRESLKETFFFWFVYTSRNLY